MNSEPTVTYSDKRNVAFNDKIASPTYDNGWLDVLGDIEREHQHGKLHLLYEKYQRSYGDQGLASNINIPYFDIGRSTNTKIIRDLIIVNNPDDAERMANTHIKKVSNLEVVLKDSIIATTDVAHWRQQRKAFNPAFSMLTKLKPLIPISETRAKYCAEILWDTYISGPKEELFLNEPQRQQLLFDRNVWIRKEVNISEFFLNETQAQLQLAMFGLSNAFQEKTNKKIRDAFSGIDEAYADTFAAELLSEIEHSNGPLSEAIKERTKNRQSDKEMINNVLIFTFAGHDTTAHTLTWLIYELCKNMEYQEELRREVDVFWNNQKDNPITYEDLKRLPFMTRCIMETLRLWPALTNGTYRETIADDYIIGYNGEKVMIPKGTYIQIPNWSRHRNPELWGDDVLLFNPYRDFKDDELWNNTVINSYNPSTKRFSPFTYGPRDCIGKNFSQIEMRIILLHILKRYHFSLTVMQKIAHSVNEADIGFNSFTLGPRNMYNSKLTDNKLGLFVDVYKRETRSKL